MAFLEVLIITKHRVVDYRIILVILQEKNSMKYGGLRSDH